MDNTKLKQIILEVLKFDDRLWNEDKTELSNIVNNFIRKYEKENF